jgi:hypothetical protein
MTNDANQDLQAYVSDMMAVETELHEAFRRQKHSETVKRVPAAASVIGRAEDTIDQHLAALRTCLHRLGSDEPTLKNAVTGVMGAAAGIIDKLRGDSPVSRTLRDDYSAICFATVCYEMLHTTALAMRDSETADLALRHLADYAPVVMEMTETMPQVLVAELSAGGKISPDSDVAATAVRNTRQAWQQASSHA